MNLSPEEKQIGKQNFDEAVGTTRREFLQTSVLVGGAAAAASLGSIYFGYGPKLDDRLRVGIIGTGDEGGVLGAQLHGQPGGPLGEACRQPQEVRRHSVMSLWRCPVSLSRW